MNIYLFKVNNKNTRKRCEIYSKLTIKTPEWRHWRASAAFWQLNPVHKKELWFFLSKISFSIYESDGVIFLFGSIFCHVSICYSTFQNPVVNGEGNWIERGLNQLSNPFQPSFAFNIETSYLIWNGNQMIGFCIKCSTGLKWVNWNIGTKWVKKKLLLQIESTGKNIWDEVFKNEPSEICGRQLLKSLKWCDLLKHKFSFPSLIELVTVRHLINPYATSFSAHLHYAQKINSHIVQSRQEISEIWVWINYLLLRYQSLR